MKRLSSLLFLLLLLPAAAVVAAPATTSTKPPGTAAIEQAGDLAAKGDIAGAIKRLERDRPQLGPRGLSLLGTLYVEANRPADGLAMLKPLADREDAEAAVLYNAGRAAIQSGNPELGRKYLSRSVAKDPSSPAARELGILYSRTGRVVESYALLRPWVLSHASDGDARLVAAALALELERPDEAQQMLAGMVESPPVQLLRARALTQQGDTAGALKLVQPIVAQHPPAVDLEVRRVAAAAYLGAGQPAKVVELLQGKAGKVPDLVLLLGRAQRQLGRTAAALATLKPLADALPDDPRTLGDPRPAAGIAIEYAQLLAASGHGAEAIGFYQKAAKLNPQSREAWTALAGALDAAGKKAEAAQARQELAKLAGKSAASGAVAAAGSGAGAASAPAGGKPPAAASGGPPKPAWAQQALDLLEQQKPQQALEVVRKELTAHPRNLLAHTMEVQVLLVTRQFPAAVEAAKRAVALDPKNANLVYQLGAAEMGAHDYANAERDLRKALSLAPQHTAAMNDLAVLLMNAGKRDEAKTLLEQVLRLHPDDKTAKGNLDQLRRDSGAGR
ncbi:MAG TPA: tetratricopeptide repeat protein [Thermoanaerobaculia bacterium]|nr:tetratricopeptide repeat protein [Thermoanaerobaculia bacterium]